MKYKVGDCVLIQLYLGTVSGIEPQPVKILEVFDEFSKSAFPYEVINARSTGMSGSYKIRSSEIIKLMTDEEIVEYLLTH